MRDVSDVSDFPTRINDTLNQTALSVRWGKSAQWIRSQGDTVIWNGERWARMEYHANGRCAGYKRVT